MAGDCPYIPNYLDRMNKVFNLLQGRMVLLGSTSGSGKSSFIDDLFILNPWHYFVKDRPDVHWEVLYYSMERNKEYKYAKWLSWMFYIENNTELAAEDVFSQSYKGPLSSENFSTLNAKNDNMTRLLDHVRVFDGRISGDMIKRHVRGKALQLGTLYEADEYGVRLQGNEYIALFNTSGKKRKNSLGYEEEYIELEHKGEKFTLMRDERYYALHNPNTFLFIILDGLGIIDTDKFGGNVKKAADDVVNTLADARDIYGFSPVIVSQFNRAISGIDRLKFHKADMAPNSGDFKDTGNAFQAADTVIGLFHPFDIKAYDARGFYGNYDLVNGLVTPEGHCTFRSAHILKNTFGISGSVFGLYYNGASAHFSTLPPADSSEIDIIYTRTRLGLN
jgi:hypothetical protein